MINLFNYIDRPSVIHRLSGASKLVFLILWTFASMITYDTRILIIMPIVSIVLFKISKIKVSDVKVMLIATLIFCIMNNLMVFVFSPQHGVDLYGTKHVLFKIAGPYVITEEQLFYHFNLLLKYVAAIPMVLLFVSTTNPSEFAASLNKIGVSYKIAYSVSLALRYIPDIQREFHSISQSQQARGLEMSRKEKSFINRLKAAANILIPLIMSSIDRIEVIANAMGLRGFGKYKTRTWYRARKTTAADYITIISAVIVLAATVFVLIKCGRFWNPFI